MRKRDIERVAKRIWRAYKASDLWPVYASPMKEWEHIAAWNRANFMFVAQWHLEQQKAVESATTARNMPMRKRSSKKRSRTASA